jgi:hypothetical protein
MLVIECAAAGYTNAHDLLVGTSQRQDQKAMSARKAAKGWSVWSLDSSVLPHAVSEEASVEALSEEETVVAEEEDDLPPGFTRQVVDAICAAGGGGMAGFARAVRPAAGVGGGKRAAGPAEGRHLRARV